MLIESLPTFVSLLLGHKIQRKPFQHIWARVQISQFSRRLRPSNATPGDMLQRRCLSHAARQNPKFPKQGTIPFTDRKSWHARAGGIWRGGV
jgi:hypothetical protein